MLEHVRRELARRRVTLGAPVAAAAHSTATRAAGLTRGATALAATATSAIPAAVGSRQPSADEKRPA